MQNTGFYLPRLKHVSSDNELVDQLHRSSVTDLRGALAEALLFGDRVTINLGGGSASTLVEWLGEKLLEEILETERIEFSFSPALVTAAYITAENARALNLETLGLTTLYGEGDRHNTSMGRATRQLADATDFPKWKVRRLARMIERHTVDVPETVFDIAYAAAKDDIGGDVGAELFYTGSSDPEDGLLANADRRKYLAVASANVQIATAASLGRGRIVGGRTTHIVMRQRMAGAAGATCQGIEDIETVLDVQGIPDLGRSITTGATDFRKIFELSLTSEAQAFRDWIAQADPADSVHLALEYQREMQARLGTPLIKGVKIVGYAGVGTALSLVDPTAGFVSGIAVNVFDSFFGDKLSQRWKPMLFMNQLRGVTEQG
ncbi:MAG: hypothetical protein AAF170_07705 [Bacteroidota bacterium]